MFLKYFQLTWWDFFLAVYKSALASKRICRTISTRSPTTGLKLSTQTDLGPSILWWNWTMTNHLPYEINLLVMLIPTSKIVEEPAKQVWDHQYMAQCFWVSSCIHRQLNPTRNSSQSKPLLLVSQKPISWGRNVFVWPLSYENNSKPNLQETGQRNVLHNSVMCP